MRRLLVSGWIVWLLVSLLVSLLGGIKLPRIYILSGKKGGKKEEGREKAHFRNQQQFQMGVWHYGRLVLESRHSWCVRYGFDNTTGCLVIVATAAGFDRCATNWMMMDGTSLGVTEVTCNNACRKHLDPHLGTCPHFRIVVWDYSDPPRTNWIETVHGPDLTTHFHARKQLVLHGKTYMLWEEVLDDNRPCTFFASSPAPAVVAADVHDVQPCNHHEVDYEQVRDAWQEFNDSSDHEVHEVYENVYETPLGDRRAWDLVLPLQQEGAVQEYCGIYGDKTYTVSVKMSHVLGKTFEVTAPTWAQPIETAHVIWEVVAPEQVSYKLGCTFKQN